MKKGILLSLVAATVLFTACGEKTDKTQEEAQAQAQAERTVELVKMEADKVASEAKEKIEVAQEKAAEMAENAKVEAEKAAAAVAEKSAEATEAVTEAASDAVESVKETTNEVVEAVAGEAAGEAAYAKCASCHGKDGKTPALGKSAVIAGQAAAVLEASLMEYKAGTRNVVGMGMLMKSQVATMSDEEIKAVSEYISKM